MYPWCIYLWSRILMHVCMIHLCMLHVAIILDPWPWAMYVWCMYPWYIHIWSLILMHVSVMHISLILDPDGCMYDTHMYDAYIYDPLSLTLMHVSMIGVPWAWRSSRSSSRTRSGEIRAWDSETFWCKLGGSQEQVMSFCHPLASTFSLWSVHTRQTQR